MGKIDLERKVEDFFRLVKEDSRDYARAYDIYTESQEVSKRINERTSEIVKKVGTAKRLTEDHADLIWLQGFYMCASIRDSQLKKIAKSILYPNGLRGLFKEVKTLFFDYQSP